MLDSLTATILKSIVNINPWGYSVAAEILDYCISHNMKFTLAMPESSLPAFHCDLSLMPLSILKMSYMPHEAGWLKPEINDYRGVADLNHQYLHNVHEVLERENAGAFIMAGGVLSFIAKHLGGSQVVG